MKPKEPVHTGQNDMFRSRVDQIIDMSHEKVVLAKVIDWRYLSEKCGQSYTEVVLLIRPVSSQFKMDQGQ